MKPGNKPCGTAVGASLAVGAGTKTMEHELTALRAEILAFQAVLSNVIFELKLLDPVLAAAIARSFDNAARQIEDCALQAGQPLSSEPFVRAVSIIRDLRTASVDPPSVLKSHLNLRRTRSSASAE